MGVFGDLLQRVLQSLQTRPKASADQLSYPVAMTVDDVVCRTAAVVPVQRGRALQTDRQVARLTEEPQLLPGVKGAEDRAAETTAGLQLRHGLNRMRRGSLLPPAGRRENRSFMILLLCGF